MRYPERPIAAFQPWLKGFDDTRVSKIVGVQLHSTRSGKSDGDDGPRTEGWWNNPQNNQGGWGSYADCLIFEDGTRVICTDPDREYPRYTAGFGYAGSFNASLLYYQIEIAQGNTADPFTDASIESTAEKCRELSLRYGFPLVRIPHLYQSRAPEPGVADHENSDNGEIYGKSDVGPMFPWERFFALATQEDWMASSDEILAEIKEIKNGVHWLTQAAVGDLDPSTGKYDNAHEQRKRLIELLEALLAKP